MSSYDCLDLCRLCLVKDRVSVPIFEGEGDVRQIFLKITACLPVKVAREDKLPKKICDDCVYKVELLYEFWNTTANAEKQLLQWLGDVGMEDKRGYVSSVMNSELMKQETVENRLDGTVMQTEEHQNNMGINMMDQMGLTMPIIMSTDQQQMTSVSMASSGNNIQAVPGTSTQSSQRGRKSGNNDDDDEEESEEEDNTDDECDNEEGLSVKEESTVSNTTGRSHEPAFVNVSIPCDEAGPSGLQQQQKISDLPEMVMTQTADGDPKSGDSRYLVKLNELNQQKAMKLLQLKFLKKPHVQNDYKVKFECKTCGENCTSFSGDNKSREFMENHLKKHIHKCPHCDKKFPLVHDVIDHIGKIHLPHFFFCANCTFNTHDKSDLSLHMATKHGELVSHDCDKCDKKFTNARSLKSHEETVHSSQAHALCQFCGFIAPTQKKLNWHEKKYHEKGLFQCTICKRELMTELGLKKHIENHETKRATVRKYECKECGKIFGKCNNLKKHSLSHSGEKPMECNVCHARFAKRSTLRQHLLTHTGKRPYSCDICGKTFVQKPGLTGHRKSHPGVHPPLPKVYIDSFIKEVDPSCVASPPSVPKLKIEGETFETFQLKR